MTFCSLCQSIPFLHLPELPLPWRNGLVHSNRGIEQFIRRTPGSGKCGPLGFPHQPSLEGLTASAITCELCCLIHESTTAFVVAYQEAYQDPVYAYHHKTDVGVSVGLPLWLTRRLDGGNGFLAFTFSQSGNTIFLVGAVGLCAEDDGPLASCFSGRPVDADAGSERILSRAASWIHECMEKHEHCQYRDNTPLPSRLLDLDCSPSPDEIRLWETGAAHGRYATLSHCWGHSGHFTSMRDSLESRKKGIKLAELPKTFLDAVMIARRLSVRYLWVDSLCICQDDAQDWERESATMAAVYSNSYLTISATNAENNSVGTLRRRPEKRHIPIDFTMEDGTSGQLLAFRLPLNKAALSRRYLEMVDQPLTARAWALQERSMAQRVLHFCYDQMYYECNEAFRSEDGIRIQGRYNTLFPGPKPAFAVMSRESRHSDEHSLWYHMLEDYTSRKLTKVSDKLPALSGLARTFARRINAEYVAGLWSNALIEGLSWNPLGGPNPAPTVYIAPSWSWASYNGIVGTSGPDWKDLATFIDYSISLKDANQYGEVTDGWLKLRAPLVPLSISDVPDEDELPERWLMRLKSPWGNPFGAHARFDTIRPHDESLVLSLSPLFALVLAWVKASDVGEADGYFMCRSLIVAAEGSGNARMKRLGIIYMDSEMLGNRNAVEESSQFAIVTLI